MNNHDLDKLQNISNNAQNHENPIDQSNNFLSQNEYNAFSQTKENLINQADQSKLHSIFPSNFSPPDKKMRRSKNDPSARNFQCKVCLKSYLGSSSLYLHLKSKHPEDFKQERTKLHKSKISNTENSARIKEQLAPSQNNLTKKVVTPIIYGFF